MCHSYLQLMKNEKVMFEAADKNKDGKLDRGEFLVFQFPEEHPAMHPHVLAQTLEEKDKDSDGFINFEEFLDRKGIYVFFNLYELLT